MKYQVRTRIKIRMDENLRTVPEDVKKECNLDKTVYDYLRELEKKGVIEVDRDNNKYVDIRLTEKGIQDLRDVMLVPFNKDIRSLVLKTDDNGAPNANLIYYMMSFKPEIFSFIGESIPQMYGTVIPDNFPDEFSPMLDEFFDNKFDNKIVGLNDISQK